MSEFLYTLQKRAVPVAPKTEHFVFVRSPSASALFTLQVVLPLVVSFASGATEHLLELPLLLTEHSLAGVPPSALTEQNWFVLASTEQNPFVGSPSPPPMMLHEPSADWPLCSSMEHSRAVPPLLVLQALAVLPMLQFAGLGLDPWTLLQPASGATGRDDPRTRITLARLVDKAASIAVAARCATSATGVIDMDEGQEPDGAMELHPAVPHATNKAIAFM